MATNFSEILDNGQGPAIITIDGKTYGRVSIFHPMKENPRGSYPQERYEFLKASIKESGQLTPIIVRTHPQITNLFRIAAGEHRWRICTELGRRIWFTVNDSIQDDVTEKEIAAIENVFHEEYAPLDLARAMKHSIEEVGNDLPTVGQIYGKSPKTVENYIALLGLHPDVLKFLDGKVPERERMPVTLAIKLINVPKDLQGDVATTAMSSGMRITEAQDHIDRVLSQSGKRQNPRAPKHDFGILDRQIARLDTVLSTRFASGEDVRRVFRHRVPSDASMTSERLRTLVATLTDLSSQMEIIDREQSELLSTCEAIQKEVDALITALGSISTASTIPKERVSRLVPIIKEVVTRMDHLQTRLNSLGSKN